MVSFWKQATLINDNRIPAFDSDTSISKFALQPDVEEEQIVAHLTFCRLFHELAVQKEWEMPDIMVEGILLIPREMAVAFKKHQSFQITRNIKALWTRMLNIPICLWGCDNNTSTVLIYDRPKNSSRKSNIFQRKEIPTIMIFPTTRGINSGYSHSLNAKSALSGASCMRLLAMTCQKRPKVK